MMITFSIVYGGMLLKMINTKGLLMIMTLMLLGIMLLRKNVWLICMLSIQL